MADLVMYVTGANAAGPGVSSVGVSASWVDSGGINRSVGFDVIVSASAGSQEINDTIRSVGSGIVAVAAHGVTVGAKNVVRIFGGALPNLT